MRRTLELLGKRLLRSRWGVAVAIAALVLVVVGVGRVFAGGAERAPALDTASPAPALTSDPKDDDTAISTEAPQLPKTSPGTAAPDAVAYAFASAWVDHQHVSAEKWHSRLLPHATKGLADKLSGVDPAGVPADRVLARPELTPIGDGLVEAAVNVNSGQLRLKLVAPDGRWLVDAVDWAPA
jgi:hypothetical protein